MMRRILAACLLCSIATGADEPVKEDWHKKAVEAQEKGDFANGIAALIEGFERGGCQSGPALLALTLNFNMGRWKDAQTLVNFHFKAANQEKQWGNAHAGLLSLTLAGHITDIAPVINLFQEKAAQEIKWGPAHGGLEILFQKSKWKDLDAVEKLYQDAIKKEIPGASEHLKEVQEKIELDKKINACLKDARETIVWGDAHRDLFQLFTTKKWTELDVLVNLCQAAANKTDCWGEPQEALLNLLLSGRWKDTKTMISLIRNTAEKEEFWGGAHKAFEDLRLRDLWDKDDAEAFLAKEKDRGIF